MQHEQRIFVDFAVFTIGTTDFDIINHKYIESPCENICLLRCTRHLANTYETQTGETMNYFSENHKRYVHGQRRRKFCVIAAGVGTLVFLLTLWEIAARAEWIDSFITSCPSRIAKTFVELCADGTILYHAFVSTYETLAGFALGTILGYLVAVLLWWNEFIQSVFEPFLVVLNSLPKIALGPIIIIWAGTGKASIVTMAVLISVVITTLNMLGGFVGTDKDKLLLLKSLGASRLQTFVKLVAPSNVPTLMSTLKINVGMAWIGSIMGEYLVSKEGLGYLLVYGSQVFRLDLVMTCTIVLCALAGLMYGAVALLEKTINKRFE